MGHATSSATANGKRKATADVTAPDAQRLVIRLLMNHTAKEADIMRGSPEARRDLPEAKRPKQAKKPTQAKRPKEVKRPKQAKRPKQSCSDSDSEEAKASKRRGKSK